MGQVADALGITLENFVFEYIAWAIVTEVRITTDELAIEMNHTSDITDRLNRYNWIPHAQEFIIFDGKRFQTDYPELYADVVKAATRAARITQASLVNRPFQGLTINLVDRNLAPSFFANEGIDKAPMLVGGDRYTEIMDAEDLIVQLVFDAIKFMIAEESDDPNTMRYRHLAKLNAIMSG